MGTELLLKASAESTSRFHRLLQDLLEEHEKQQSLLRREILRLGGEAFDASGTSGALGASGAGDALEVLDPEGPSEDEGGFGSSLRTPGR